MRLIDQDALMEFPIRIDHYDKENGSKDFVLGIESVLEYAENLPTIEARPVVRGEWIEKPHTDGFGGHYFLYHCSRCDTPNAKKRNFCNECGADMGGEEDG